MDAFYMPPDGSLDIRGFSSSATFLRGVFDKIGVEPQVQRIGKYKSFGDSFNRTSIAEAQREVISSLLTEASSHWLKRIAERFERPVPEVATLWSDSGFKTVQDLKVPLLLFLLLLLFRKHSYSHCPTLLLCLFLTLTLFLTFYSFSLSLSYSFSLSLSFPFSFSLSFSYSYS
jgi:hypothetical protein